MEKYRSWVEKNKFSDHHPIFCQLDFEGIRICKPFKFNHAWLGVDGFMDLVCRVWNETSYSTTLSPMEKLTMKLSLLKEEVFC